VNKVVEFGGGGGGRLGKVNKVVEFGGGGCGRGNVVGSSTTGIIGEGCC
jgi:hypothetical protein